MISANYVDLNLKRMFTRIAPDSLGSSKLRELFNFTGPLGSFGAKTQIAIVCGLIPKNLGASINALRSLRNKVAHSSSEFRLRDQKELVKRIFELGPDMPSGINYMVVKFLVENAVEILADVASPFGAEGEMAFKHPREILDFLEESAEARAILDEKAPKLELAIGTAIICGLLFLHVEDWQLKMKGDSKP